MSSLSYRPKVLVLAVLLCGVAAAIARADVKRAGDWPDPDSELVSLSFSGERSDAIKKLAEAAGWSIVMRDAPEAHLNIQVKDQPASAVLDVLLSDGSFAAARTGKMIAISPQPVAAAATTPAAAPAAAAPSPDVPPPLPPPPGAAPAKKAKPSSGKDRTITGHSVTIGADEVVGDLTVLGGSAEVYGTITGDLSVFGGSLELRDGSHVYGDVSAVGGSVEIATGAQVDGDVNSAGGNISRHDKGDHSDKQVQVDDPAPKPDRKIKKHVERASEHRDEDWSGGFLSTVGRTALLFAFGTILLALLGPRMERLQQDFSERPARAFALGAVGLGVGVIGVIALCITIIGIPVAIVAILLGVLSVYAGICAVFTGLGAALLRHRSESPYVHLGVGCALYCLISMIPVIGTFVTVIAVLVGAGVLISTRAAGMFEGFGRGDEQEAA